MKKFLYCERNLSKFIGINERRHYRVYSINYEEKSNIVFAGKYDWEWIMDYFDNVSEFDSILELYKLVKKWVYIEDLIYKILKINKGLP